MKIRHFAIGLLLALALVLIFSLGRTLTWPKSTAPTNSLTTSTWQFTPTSAENHLQSFLKIPTVSPEDPTSRDETAFLRALSFLKNTYPLTHKQLHQKTHNQLSLVFHWPGQQAELKPVLLMAHYDVVPVENQNWSKDPFGGEMDHEFIFGRGAVDDKSSVIALFEAIEMALKNHWQPQRSLYLVIGHDEEVGGNEGAVVIAESFRKAGLEFEFILDEGGIITNGSRLGIPEEVALIGIAEKGYANIEVLAKGTPGHSSMPGPTTAIGRLAKALHKVEENPFPPAITGAFQKTLEGLVPHASPFQKWALSNLWLTSALVTSKMAKHQATNAFIRTSQAITMIEGGSKENVLPAEAQANINLRLLPGDTGFWALQRLTKLLADQEVQVRRSASSIYAEASAISPTNSLGYQLIEQAIRSQRPELVPIPYLLTGATDSRHFKDLSPNIYRFLFASLYDKETSYLHGVDERIRRKDFIDGINFYTTLIQNL